MPVVLLLKNWRLVASAVLALAIILAWAYLTHLQHIAKAQKQQLAQAAKQAQVQTAATQAVDHLATKTVEVQERTHEVIRTIQAAPGADSAVPDGVLAAWRSGLPDDPAQPAH